MCLYHDLVFVWKGTWMCNQCFILSTWKCVYYVLYYNILYITWCSYNIRNFVCVAFDSKHTYYVIQCSFKMFESLVV